MVSAQFLNSGATDFLNKPFLTEEFYCRITQNIAMLEYIHEVRELSVKDSLTGLFNRRHFFDVGRKLFAAAKREKKNLAVVTIDIDKFKKVNDLYGHDAGDLVIKAVAQTLLASFRETDVVARFGGEEFCVLLANPDLEALPRLQERVRRIIANTKVPYMGQTIQVTVSVGASTRLWETLENVIAQSDQMLFLDMTPTPFL